MFIKREPAQTGGLKKSDTVVKATATATSLDADGKQTVTVTLDIEYELPRRGPARLFGWLLARPYSAWCLRAISAAAKRALEAASATEAAR